METVRKFIFLGSKITADGDLSHKIKRRLLLGRRAMTNLDSVVKSRDITLLTKDRIVKALVLPVVMYGCESWTIKEAECRPTTATCYASRAVGPGTRWALRFLDNLLLWQDVHLQAGC